MTFSSITYLVFFTIVCAFMALTNLIKSKLGIFSTQKIRHSFLLISSYVFYGWWDFRFCFLMLALTLVAYFTALEVAKNNKYCKLCLTLGVAVPLVILGIFKYFNFFIDSFASAFGISSIHTLSIILPVGISFYTFQSLSYTIDVSRNRLPAQKSFLKLALYISFFPQLVAGPIVKANDFIPQLDEDRSISLKNLEKGIQIFFIGMLKKVVIADNISVFVDEVFGNPKEFSGMTVLLGVVAYAIQIYCDFAGYSDMAIGSAKCIGFDINRNFNLPYISRNVSEFWKRWHISLSTWLMEYLYIPLGGNRKGKVRTYLNLIITMLLGGLWHGANWTFVAWGLFHGIGLCVHKLYMKLRKRDKNYKGKLIPNIISTIFTFAFVCFGWIFFRADNFVIAWNVIKAVFTMQKGVAHPFVWVFIGIGFIIIEAVIAAIKSKKEGLSKIEDNYICLPLDKIWGLTAFAILVFAVLGFAYTGSNPFIYFQF